jgi:predicted DNA-binding transcriptional regulator AlpA
MSASQEHQPELPSDWWTAEDCGRYLGITASTWRAYVAREQAPRADRRFGRATVWLPATVKEWARARPRRPDTSTD